MHPAVRGHQLARHQLVAGQPVLAHVEADAAAEEEAAHPHARAAAVGDGDAELPQRRVERAVVHAAADGRDAGPGVDLHPVDEREVDHHAARRRVAGVRVPATPRGEGHVEFARPEDALGDVVGIHAAGDAAGKYGAVAEVVRRRDLRVARVSRPQERTGQAAVELAPRGGTGAVGETSRPGPRRSGAGAAGARHERQLPRPDQEPTSRDELVHSLALPRGV